MKRLFLAVLAAAALAGAASAQQVPVSPEAASICDPAFQDYAETTIGYLNPRTGLAARLRDSVAAPAREAGYVFVSILPSRRDYAPLLRGLSAAGFVFRGERVRLVRGERRVRLIGWAKAGSVEAIRASAGVAAVSVGKARRAAI